MSIGASPLGVLTVAAAGTESEELPNGQIRRAIALFISGPAVLAETATIEVKLLSSDVWVELVEAGAAIEIGASQLVRVDFPAAFEAMRIALGSAAAAQRDFAVAMVEDYD